MSGTLEPSIERIHRAETLEDLNGEILALREAFEVEHLVYHSVNSTGEQYAALTYSDEWVDQYLTEDYARIDPVVQGCYRRFHPVDWKNLNWSGKAAREFMGRAQDAGVGNQGFSVPIRGPSGQFALFTVSHQCNDDEWAKYTETRTRDLILMSHFVNQKALEIERGTDITSLQSLSPREKDTLTMLAVGYSRAQAAESLSISEHTLRVYIESARFKLGAMNTTHALARALSMGLLVV
ncbi:MAG: LuxR family transcriptional regulator [Rhodobacteraceae bacterium]|nr:LuxR family transcriptional regulator [Paracoccaceae bacterium]